MTDWNRVLLAIEPRSKPDIRAGLAASMDQCITHADLLSRLRLAHFLAQICHESGGLRYVVEIWGPTAAQRRYEGRVDLGNVVPGDGKRFMGRGLMQNTGRANYARLSKAFKVNFEGQPELMAKFPWAALTGAEYWRANNINPKADRDDALAVSIAINGRNKSTGLPNGYEDRRQRLATAKHALADLPAALKAQASTERAAATQRTGQAKAAGTAVVATQAAHAAPTASATPAWAQTAIIGAIGLGLVLVAVMVARKAKEHAAIAAELETASQGV